MNKAPSPTFFFLTGNTRDGREEAMGHRCHNSRYSYTLGQCPCDMLATEIKHIWRATYEMA